MPASNCAKSTFPDLIGSMTIWGVLLPNVDHLIQCEVSGLHDTARDEDSRAVSSFLDDRTHKAFLIGIVKS